MVAYPGRAPLDPIVAKALAEQKSLRPKLRLNPRLGNYVSKHRGGRQVGVTEVTGFNACSALIFKTPLHEDLDGAPNSYAPPISVANLNPQPGLHPIETSIKNATNQS